MNPKLLNMKNLLLGDVGRLRFTTRYNTFPVQNRESVAEHSYYVALYAMFICDWTLSHVRHLPSGGTEAAIDKGAALEKALMHDLEEAKTGDFPRHFKHSTTELRKHLSVAALAGMHQLIDTLTENGAYHATLEMRWSHAKDPATREGRVVEFADFLSVLSYFLYEFRAGNWGVMEHAGLMAAYYSTFKTPGYDFIRPLVEEVDAVMEELFRDNQIRRRGEGTGPAQD